MSACGYDSNHPFAGLTGTPLTATLQLIQKPTNAILDTWVLSDPSDNIGTTVGGNRYGWFVQNEIPGLAIDNSFRTGAVSTPLCTTNITNGGWTTANNG